MLELAWAAGFFDGEGSVTFTPQRPGRRPRVYSSVAQVRREPLDRFASAVGIGTVRGPYTQRSCRQRPYFAWRVEGYDALAQMYLLLGTHLCSPKRDALLSALTRYEEFLADPQCSRGHGVMTETRDGSRLYCRACKSRAGRKAMDIRYANA